jgi:hypothetical protein
MTWVQKPQPIVAPLIRTTTYRHACGVPSNALQPLGQEQRWPFKPLKWTILEISAGKVWQRACYFLFVN